MEFIVGNVNNFAISHANGVWLLSDFLVIPVINEGYNYLLILWYINKTRIMLNRGEFIGKSFELACKWAFENTNTIFKGDFIISNIWLGECYHRKLKGLAN